MCFLDEWMMEFSFLSFRSVKERIQTVYGCKHVKIYNIFTFYGFILLIKITNLHLFVRWNNKGYRLLEH